MGFRSAPAAGRSSPAAVRASSSPASPRFDFDDTGVGAHYLFGFGHDNGFFTEVRLGSGKAQQLKVGVGWAISLD